MESLVVVAENYGRRRLKYAGVCLVEHADERYEIRFQIRVPFCIP